MLLLLLLLYKHTYHNNNDAQPNIITYCENKHGKDSQVETSPPTSFVFGGGVERKENSRVNGVVLVVLYDELCVLVIVLRGVF